MLAATALALVLAQAVPSTSAAPVAPPVPVASGMPGAPLPGPAASAMPTPVATTMPAPGASAMPAAQSGAPAAAGAGDASLAVIVNSGSTNTAGYTLRVRDDGWTTLEHGGTAQHKRVDKQLARRLFTDLRAAGPLAALPRAMCMKSVSFGSSTTVAYRGATSPDLSCPSASSAGRALAADAEALRAALGVTLLPARRLPTP